MASKSTRAVTKVPSKSDLKEFRKTNEAIGLRVAAGKLSLLSRKIFNAMVYHAQRSVAKGENAPIKSEAAANYYWIPLKDLARDAAYGSRDTQLFKEQLESLLEIRVFSEDAIQWMSERLVSGVRLVNPRGLKSGGGIVWFGFAFPPEVERMILSPSSYTKLSIYYQAVLRSGASLALYESCRRYLSNPSKVTNRARWEWWFNVLTGSPVGDEVPEYRYFKRDVLKSAIAEINLVTDINVELIEHKVGRAISEIQFKVVAARQSPLEFDGPAPDPVIDSSLIERLMALGIPQEAAQDLLATTDEATLSATLKLTEDRINSPSATKVLSPAGYFRQALRGRYASASAIAKESVKRQPREKSVAESIQAIKDKYLAKRAKDAYAMFNEMSDAEREDWLTKFKVSPSANGIKFTRGLASPSTRTAFALWLAEEHWGTPDDSDLLQFAATLTFANA